MIRYFHTLILISITLWIHAQSSLDAHVGLGKVIQHKEELLFDIPPISYSIEINYSKRLTNHESWYDYWGKPNWVTSAQYISFGDKDVLGHAYGISTGFDFNILDFSKTKLGLQVTTGLSYLDKVYDRILNPTNNAISSSINNTTKFSLAFSYALDNTWMLRSHVQLVHFSNARTKSPNSGINMWNVGISASRKIGKTRSNTKQIDIANQLDNPRRLSINIQQGIGWTQEREIGGGPSYHVFTTQIYAGYNWSAGHSAIMGLSYEYNEYIYAFNLQILRPIDQAHKNAKDLSFLIGDQLMFGAFRAQLAIGYYLQYPSTRIGEPIYFNVGLQYRPKALKAYHMQPYVQIHMKSHYAIAESLNISFGLCF